MSDFPDGALVILWAIFLAAIAFVAIYAAG